MEKLFNKDCLEAFREIESESVDLIVTDCPYHIVQGGCSTGAYGNQCKGILGKKSGQESDIYTKQGKLFKFNEIKFSEWLPECFRILKANHHIYINARNLAELQKEAEKVGFEFQQILVWDKGNATPNRYYLNACEFILMLRKGKAKNINNMGTMNILRIPNIIGNKLHPTEKPVELNKIMIANSTNKGDLVMDCFMGAGSSGVACKELERDFIGVEIDKKYFDIAEKRINGVNIDRNKKDGQMSFFDLENKE